MAQGTMRVRETPWEAEGPEESGRIGWAREVVEPPTRSDTDALDDLAHEITTLYAHVHAATHRLLTLIAEFDRLRGWEPAGHRSCAHWLAVNTGIDLGAARERVRVARALGDLPETSESMARGELSFAKVRALSRVATAESEGDLLEYARATTAAGLERLVRGWKRSNRLDEAEVERARHASRCFSVFPDEDGMYLVRGRLDPEVGAVLMRAVEAASDALYRKEQHELDRVADALGVGEPESLRATPKQRRADAIGLVAERGLAAGFGGEGGSGARAERYQVVIHVDEQTLSADSEPGRSELDDGTRVSAETSRRVACDSGAVRITRGADGSVLDVGRKTRTIPPALRRALEARDRGCRFPGCGLRFTDAHHVRHWADGGPTRLENLVLLCRRHHRAVHEEGFRVELAAGDRANFYDKRGLPIPEMAPPANPGEHPVEALIRQNRLRGVEPSGWESSARFKRETDVPWAIEAAAREALG